VLSACAQIYLHPSRSDPPPASGTDPKRDTCRAKDRLRVLLVEDEALVALDMETSLQAAGFEVVGTADTQDDAVAMARQYSPDVIVMDITLRKGDGISAAMAIGDANCIVFVSGNSDPKTEARARRVMPAAVFLKKPYNADELPRAVMQAFARHTGS
jgi:two-component system, response regulator PdtaR